MGPGHFSVPDSVFYYGLMLAVAVPADAGGAGLVEVEQGERSDTGHESEPARLRVDSV